MSSRAAAFDFAAALLRSEANGIDRVVDSYLERAVRQLPDAWAGPAATQLESELLNQRATLCTVAAEVRGKADRLAWEAEVLRRADAEAAAAAAASEGVTGAL